MDATLSIAVLGMLVGGLIVDRAYAYRSNRNVCKRLDEANSRIEALLLRHDALVAQHDTLKSRHDHLETRVSEDL